MNEVFAAVNLTGLEMGVGAILIGFIVVVLVYVGYDWVLHALFPKKYCWTSTKTGRWVK